jgi:hypothetical protein
LGQTQESHLEIEAAIPETSIWGLVKRDMSAKFTPDDNGVQTLQETAAVLKDYTKMQE